MKSKQYLIIAVATLIAFTVAGTYAFFQVLGGNTETRNVNVVTNTTDQLTFSVTKDIEIEASKENFGRNAGNLSDSTTATARLIPNSKTHTASADYNVYVVIDSNNFVYTTEDHTPELTLTITDPTNTPVANITGLNSIGNGVFDITTRTGAFLVAEDYDIEALTAAGTTQTWTMTVTLVNLDTNQFLNTGKTLSGTIYITKEDLTTYSLAELNAIRTSRIVNGEEVSNIGSTSITVDAEATAGTEGLSTYYFGIEEQTSTGYLTVANKIIDGIEYFESNVPTYTFTNLKDNTNYTIHAFVEDNEGFKSNIYNTTVKTNNYVLPQVTNVSVTPTSLTSMSVTATASAGENVVSKYYFNCGDGNGWSVAQDSNTYTCTGLTYNTNYNIQVKVIDTYGKYSVEYVNPSEITAYQVTYTCTNCTSSKNSEYILAGGNSTADITANTHYNLTNPTVNGCTINNGVVTVSNVSGNTTCSVTAKGNSVTCTAGNYLPANTETCATCTAGNYCTGWSGNYDGSSHGLAACSSLGTGYTSAAGASANTGCYLAVSAGYYKTSANGTSTATCANGSYKAAHNSNYGSSDSCTACAGGKTNSGTGNSVACTTTCSNSANVESWKTPSWSNNTVSNLCAANTCATNYEISGNNCIESITYKYWTISQGGSGSTYQSNQIPSGAKSTIAELSLSYYATFVKTSIRNGTPIGHEVCLNYRNNVFCLGPDYWTGTINSYSTQAGANTLTKLKNDMQADIGTTPTCTYSQSNSNCYYGNTGSTTYECSSSYDGASRCAVTTSSVCIVYHDGRVLCTYVGS